MRGKRLLLIICVLLILGLCPYTLIAQGVAINSDGSSANSSAMLDVKSTNSGLLIPRISIPNLSAATPVTSPAVSLLVYNTNAGTGVGYYYWTGTQWMRLAATGDLNFVNGSGSATRVAFWTGATSLGSNSNLYWDNVNDRLGIGTSSPQEKLHIVANSTTGYPSILLENTSGHTWEFWPIDGNDLRIRDVTDGADRLTIKGVSGNIGIGTTDPTAKLHVNGTVRFQGLGTGTQITGLMTDANGNISSRNLNISNWDDAYSWGDHALAGYLTSLTELDPTWNGAANQTGTIGRTGNVGIGNVSPSQRLHVTGNARITGAYYDSNNNSGTANQVLSSTATGTAWTKAQTIQSNSASVTAGNWYRIASNSGNRADASFTLRDEISGGGHSTMRFHAGINYGNSSGISFNLVSHSIYSIATFTKVRIVRNSTYDGAYLEVYCNRTGSVEYDIFDNYQNNGWTPVDWTAGSIPSGWTAHEYETDRLLAIGASNDILSLNRSGYLGLGTASPAAQLHTTGTVRFANYSSGANGAIIRTDASGNLATTNFTGSSSNILLGNNTFGTIQDAGGVVSSCGTANYVPKMTSSTAMSCSQIFDNGTNVGIGTASPTTKLTIAGEHEDTKLRLYSTGNGSDQPSNLSLWASEPGVTYTGTGIGYNVNGHPHYGRIDATRGSAYIRFLPTETKFEFQNSSGTTVNDVMVVKETGRVGISTSNPGAKLDIKDHANTGIMLYLTDDNSNTGELDHKAIQVQTQTTIQSWVATNGDAFFNGDVGIGTSTPDEKLHVNGNAKATGYITAGTATTGSTTRYGSEEFTYDNHVECSDGTAYYYIGALTFPTGVTSIVIKSIIWEVDGAHEDANEDHNIHVGIGPASTTASYYGFGSSASNGYEYIDWHYVEDDLSLTRSNTQRNIYMRLYDEDAAGNDNLHVYNMHIIISYTYSVALQTGDIAASGRIYANNTHSVGDLAEHFEYKGPISTGFVISYVPGTDNEYEMCSKPYSDHITGVISENPSVVLNSPEQGPPLALAGRVNVKIVDSGELIKGGDFITSSSTPGFAMKATKPGPVIGYAVKNQKSGEDFVEILLQPGKHYIPKDYIDAENSYEQENTNKRPGKY